MSRESTRSRLHDIHDVRSQADSTASSILSDFTVMHVLILVDDAAPASGSTFQGCSQLALIQSVRCQ